MARLTDRAKRLEGLTYAVDLLIRAMAEEQVGVAQDNEALRWLNLPAAEREAELDAAEGAKHDDDQA